MHGKKNARITYHEKKVFHLSLLSFSLHIYTPMTRQTRQKYCVTNTNDVYITFLKNNGGAGAPTWLKNL